ncbi:MAG: hypothetical protein ABIH50_04070 [bacterium]
MKKSVAAFLSLVIAIGMVGVLSGCLQPTGEDDAKLISTVSFDTGVSKEKIKIISKEEGMGSGLYQIEADGKLLKYKRTGTEYYESSKNPMDIYMKQPAPQNK